MHGDPERGEILAFAEQSAGIPLRSRSKAPPRRAARARRRLRRTTPTRGFLFRDDGADFPFTPGVSENLDGPRQRKGEVDEHGGDGWGGDDRRGQWGRDRGAGRGRGTLRSGSCRAGERRAPGASASSRGLPDPAYVARGRAALAALEASAPDAGAGEKIIHELVANQFALALAIGDAEIEGCGPKLGHYRQRNRRASVAISRALKELTTLSNAIGRRIEGALITASTLRAQRRLWNVGRS